MYHLLFPLIIIGAFWQVLLLLTFFVAIGLAISRFGRLRLGERKIPEMGSFKWISVILCTLLAAGGVFWAAGGPISHFLDLPPSFDGKGPSAGSESAVGPALSVSYLHWGFLAWTVLGTLSTIIFMHAHYKKGMPLKPRTLLYPMFGEKVVHSWVGTLIDVFSIIAVAAGTIGPIGFLGLQAGYGLNVLTGIPDNYTTHLVVIVVLVTIASISAATGLQKGIQFLSRYNVILTIILAGLVLLLGPARFVIDTFIDSYGGYLENFIPMSLFRGDTEWLSEWTTFFWGWFIGYAPMMGIFVARISRGRTIRQLVTAVAIIAPVVTNFWYAVVGGTGLFYELQESGSISTALDKAGKPAAMIEIMEQLPLGGIIALGFLIVTMIFVATTADSMSYTIAMTVSGNDEPPRSLRVFWALIMGAVAAVLLILGEGGIDALQSFIVVSAVPVSIILLPTLWMAPKVAKQMEAEQS